MKLIRNADELEYDEEFQVKYTANFDNPNLEEYCVITTGENDKMDGTVSEIRSPKVHFNTMYADQPLYIDFSTGELRASGDDSLLGTDVTVYQEDDCDASDAVDATIVEGEIDDDAVIDVKNHSNKPDR